VLEVFFLLKLSQCILLVISLSLTFCFVQQTCDILKNLKKKKSSLKVMCVMEPHAYVCGLKQNLSWSNLCVFLRFQSCYCYYFN